MAIEYALKALVKNGKRTIKNGVKNGVNGVVNGNGIKNGANGFVTPQQAYIKEQAAKRNTSQIALAPEETYVEVPNHGLNNYVDSELRKIFPYDKSPIGKKGHAQNFLSYSYYQKRINPEITPREIELKYEKETGLSRTYDGTEYRLVAGGTKKAHSYAEEGQRRLQFKKNTQVVSGKKTSASKRLKHLIVPEEKESFEAIVKQAADENSKAVGSLYKRGRRVKPGLQLISHEHDIALRAYSLWDKIGFQGNHLNNIFIQRNAKARWWKDAAESWFYSWIKKRGNNWYIKNDRSNLKDIEIWEVSTNKKLGTIKFQNDKNLSEQSINQMKRLLKKAAQGYKA
jgi:hypothetical protein